MKKMKLTSLAKNEIKRTEMNTIKGMGCSSGCGCGCGCIYEGHPGGSSTSANGNANNGQGIDTGGCPGKPGHGLPITIKQTLIQLGLTKRI